MVQFSDSDARNPEPSEPDGELKELSLMDKDTTENGLCRRTH